MDPRPDRQRDPRREHHDPDNSEYQAVDTHAPAAGDTEEENDREGRQTPQRDLTRAASALLRAKRGREPVHPEDDPGDSDGGLERVHPFDGMA